MTSRAPPVEKARIIRDAGGNAYLEGGDGAVSAAGLNGVLALAIASAPTGITVADPSLPDCPLVFINPAFTQLTGYPPEEVLGRNCRFLQGRGTEKESVRALRLAIAAGKPITLEFTNHRRDGRRFVNELRMAPVMDEKGQLVAYIGIQHDVTARKRAEREAIKARRAAERANQEKSDFLAFMSHEVRTPLHGVMGTLALLLDTALDAEQRAYAETAQRCGATLLHTVNELLDLSRIEAGKLDVHSDPFSLADIVKDVLDLLAPAAAEKGIELSASLDHLLPGQLVGDPSRIRQVLINLTDNAVKFTHRGSVELRIAALPDGHVGFAVTDTGIGIPPKLRQSLFTRFAQADQAGEQTGSGLGLAICKRLVALMGGQIAVDSTPGRGSTFFFDLPLAHVPESGTPPPRIAPQPVLVQPLAGAHGRILLAEDGKANQLVAAAILRKAGYTVELARDGAEAAAAAESSDYDLILMDVRMPLMDGYAATRAIRAVPGPRGRVPIIAMTASVMPGDTERCTAAGMDGHLPKPLGKAELLAAVQRVLDARPRRPRVPIPEAEPGATAPLLDRETLEELRAAVGPGRLPRLISVFTAETKERVRRMHAMTDPVRIEDEAHSLKAAAATFGAIALRDAARALEDACQGGQPEEWRRILDLLPGLADRSIAAFPLARAEARAKQDREQKGR
ncbi:response regulator [Roseococcus sp. SDR]|uniref:ATP-binding protein n=1 Tax=Roseococcus sp. SDR TaxID=2835532 RepID=UPI001BCDCFC9|nr:ATP-binding protein [Roseococcus sp. SDR]MBS7788949.1 response regulator [Roseococcus sp. SDR]MBV1844263.1 response regulator [Roseococcus sp. SDR]